MKTTHPAFFPSQILKDLMLLTLVLGLFFGIGLGSRPFSTPDEGRYVEIPREMAATGDWVTPRLNGVLYFEKPPLFYWLQAGMIKLLGIQEGTMRLLPALFGLLGCLMTYGAGVALGGRRRGLLGAFILGTTLLYYVHTRLIILDLAVSIFVSGALFCFLLGVRQKTVFNRNAFLLGFFSSCAGAVLTKGLMGLVIPGGVIFFWILLYKRWDALKMAFWPWGLGLFLTLTLPWHFLMALRHATFLDFYFIHEHFIRFLMDAHGRTQPFLFFVPVLFLGFFPWICFVPQGFLSSFQEAFPGKTKKTSEGAPSETLPKPMAQEEGFLILWVVGVFLFFSLGKSKLIPYIMPLFPALALIVARYGVSVWTDQESQKRPRGFKIGMRLYSVLALVLVGGFWGAAFHHGLLDQSGFMPFLYTGSAALLMGSFSVWVLENRPRVQALAVALSSCFLMMTVNQAWSFVDYRSIKPLALKIKALRQKGDAVVTYHQYYQDLPVYLEQVVNVVSWDGELKFGMAWEDTGAWMLTEGSFERLWSSDKRVFALMRKDGYKEFKKRWHKDLCFIMKFGRDVLVTNQPLCPQGVSSEIP